MCVGILLHMCRNAAASGGECTRLTFFVLLHFCPRTATYVSSYSYICFLCLCVCVSVSGSGSGSGSVSISVSVSAHLHTPPCSARVTAAASSLT
jgi:hypothetical protein